MPLYYGNKWYPESDSNRQHTELKSDASTNCATRALKMVDYMGFEPTRVAQTLSNCFIETASTNTVAGN